MNKSLLIVCPGTDYLKFWDEKSIIGTAVGGTETVLIEISAELSRAGYSVTLVGSPETRHISSDGVEYISYSDAAKEYSNKEFDVGFFYFLINTREFKCKKKIMISSCELIQDDGAEFASSVDDSLFDKVFCLSDWHRNEIHSKQGVPLNKLEYVPNCIGYTGLYSNALEYEKENAMVWSSRYERNFEFLMDRIYPKIVKYFPDFKVYLCGYIDSNGRLSEKYGDCNVEVLGRLNKKELAEYQKKCKVWIYPNIGVNVADDGNWFFHETFCNTAVENALARNAVICLGGGKDGITTTLEGYDLIPGGIFKEYEVFYETDFEAVANSITSEVFRCLQYENYWKRKVDGDAYRKICEKYKVENVAKYWINAIENE